MIIFGIDPGLSGAAAALQPVDAEGDEFIVDAIDLPIMDDGTKNQIDERALAEWILRTAAGRPARAFIENVRAMPSLPGNGGQRRTMGAASSFRFGLAAGQIRATFRLSGIPLEFVEAASWKKWFDLRGADKEASRQLALKMWPVSGYLMRRKKDHQRAEAMLIAKFGIRPIIGRGRRG
jgi:hypothetical protein